MFLHWVNITFTLRRCNANVASICIGSGIDGTAVAQVVVGFVGQG